MDHSSLEEADVARESQPSEPTSTVRRHLLAGFEIVLRNLLGKEVATTSKSSLVPIVDDRVAGGYSDFPTRRIRLWTH